MPDRGLFVLEDGSNTGTSSKQARRALGSWLGRATGGVVRPGVLVDDMSAVVVGKADMSYDIRPAGFVTKFSDANGPTVAMPESTVNVTTTAAPGSNSRIDTVYAIHRLLTADGGSGTTNVLEFAVVQGSVAASPTAPAVPSGGVRIVDVTVTAGATATSGLTMKFPDDLWTAANGGVVPTAKGSRLGRVWDGTRHALVTLGLVIRGQSDTVKSVAYQQVGRQTVSSDGAGVITVNLEQTYGSTVLGVVATSVGATYPLTLVWTGSTTSTITFRVFRNDTDTWFGSQDVDLCYTAWGY